MSNGVTWTRPSLYIGICTVLWGITSALTGVRISKISVQRYLIQPHNQVTKNFTGIILCRVFIGLPEAAFYPGAIYLLSRWYTKKVLKYPLIAVCIFISISLRNLPSVQPFCMPGCLSPTHLEVWATFSPRTACPVSHRKKADGSWYSW